MLQGYSISLDDMIHQVKLSCQIPAIADAIAARQIVAKTAEVEGINPELSELQQAADKFRFSHDLESEEATWAWLKKHQLSLDDFEELIHAKLLSKKLAQHLFADKVNPFWVEHQLDYVQVVMYEIVLADQDLAMELFYALEEGEISFWEAAHQYIQEPELRRTGGYRGLLRRKDLRPEMSAAIFAAKPPQLLKPIVINQKAHLILVEEIIQPELTDQFRSQILSDLFSDWLAQQVKKAEMVALT
ncbi:MAG: peptidylprolyl isomerase [Leptolyngbyaceae cyanobacterium MO_188.B28]|nr:peptidylprolyl isomerase [Leptolyngbyaceae cyanobacterium MO_188.B28]